MSESSADWTRPDLDPPRRRRRRWPVVLVASVVVLAGLAVAADRIAAAYAENQIASEVQKQGFGAKPDVTIYGFPFLTQVAAHRFPRARMTASDVREGPLTIHRIDAVARDVRVRSGFQSGTIGHLDGTATVAFAALTRAAGQSDVKLSADGPDRVKADVDLGIGSGTAIARVTKEGRDRIRVHAVSVEGFSLEDLGDTLDFTVPVTDLPLGMEVQSVRVSSDGVELRITGSNVAF
jgi:hypothetical protein